MAKRLLYPALLLGTLPCLCLSGAAAEAAPCCSAAAHWGARCAREAGDPKKALAFLPADKQYLVTRNGARPGALEAPTLHSLLLRKVQAAVPPSAETRTTEAHGHTPTCI